MKYEDLLSEARTKLKYDPISGDVWWLKQDDIDRFTKAWNTKSAGKIAGWIKTDKGGKKYRRLRMGNKMHYVHRLIWLIMTGKMPDEIDHKDGNGLNNKWDNLRNVSHLENGMNQRLKSSNTSGVMGVGYNKRHHKWCSRITINKQRIFLGFFSDKFDAICARKSAEINAGFHDNHGTLRPL